LIGTLASQEADIIPISFEEKVTIKDAEEFGICTIEAIKITRKNKKYNPILNIENEIKNLINKI
jgi:hypothetical protein